MRFVLVFVVLLVTGSSFAAMSDAEFLKARFNGMLPSERRLSRSESVVDTAERFAQERGIKTTRVLLKTPEGQSYSALLISTEGNSIQNVEAKRVANSMANLPLYFSPLDLSFGSEAYFMADGSSIGVPYEFFTEGPTDSSYVHELLHAETHRRLVFGDNPLWAGYAKASGGERAYLTNKNTGGYSSLVALEEILTTALSVKLETEELIALKKSLSKEDFETHWGPGRERLASIHHALENGIGLAKQTADMADRALAKLGSVAISEKQLTIGEKTQTVHQAVFKLDAYEYGSSVRLQSVPNGTDFVLYSVSKPTLETLRTRLGILSSKSREAEGTFTAAFRTIKQGIVHVEVAKSDIESLAKFAGAPHHILLEETKTKIVVNCSHLF